MKTLIKKKTTISNNDNLILLCNKKSILSKFNLSKQELNYIKIEQKKGEEIVTINQYTRLIFIIIPKKKNDINAHAENCRLIGDILAIKLQYKTSTLILDLKNNQTEAMQIAEGMALSNYTFTKHQIKIKPNKLKTIYLCKKSNKKALTELQNVIDAVYLTRDLINEPFSHLTAKELANAAIKSGKKY